MFPALFVEVEYCLGTPSPNKRAQKLQEVTIWNTNGAQCLYIWCIIFKLYRGIWTKKIGAKNEGVSDSFEFTSRNNNSEKRCTKLMWFLNGLKFFHLALYINSEVWCTTFINLLVKRAAQCLCIWSWSIYPSKSTEMYYSGDEQVCSSLWYCHALQLILPFH